MVNFATTEYLLLKMLSLTTLFVDIPAKIAYEALKFLWKYPVVPFHIVPTGGLIVNETTGSL
jgi:hypothetical protein